MKALIDGDILVYRVGFGANEEHEALACARMDESVQVILDSTRASSKAIYLTSGDKSNFRIALFPEYKANRKQPKPVHYDALRNHLVNTHAAELIYGQEADDAMGIEATRVTDAIVCSIDKDLDQIPGQHFNFVKGIIYNINPYEGRLKFYTQLLMGDATDNIKGIPGIGPKRAATLLKGCTSEEDMYNACLDAYKAFYPEDYMKLIICYGQLLKIRQVEGELWSPPNSVPAVT